MRSSGSSIAITVPLDDAPPPPRRPRRPVRLLVLFFLAAVILLVATQYALLHRAEFRLAWETARWSDLGLSLPAHGPPLPPDDENLAVALNRAAALVTFSAEFESNLLGLIPMPFEGTGVRQQTDAELAANAKAFAALSAARKLTKVGWSGYDVERMLFHDGPPDEHQPTAQLRQLVSLCALDAQRAIDRGDEHRFVDRLADVRLISRALGSDPDEVSDAISATYDAIATDTALAWTHRVRIIGPDAPYVRQRLASLTREWADGQRGADLRAIFTRAAANTLAGISKTPIKYRRKLDAGDDYFFPTSFERVPHSKIDDLLWIALRPQRIAAATTLIERLRTDLAAADAADWLGAQRVLSRATPWTPTGVEPLDSALQSVLPLRQLEADNVQYLRHRMHVLLSGRLAAASIACRLYAIDHAGADPATLADLVPAYLPAVPVDPFNPSAGAPIGYGRNAAGLFVYGLADAGIDLIATGGFKPTLADHMNWQKSVNLVAFLNPYPTLPPLPAAATVPATAPSSTQGVKQ